MKAYIVVDKEQEFNVLKKLEEKGLNWSGGNANLTEWLPSEDGFLGDDKFPYIIFEREYVLWGNIEELDDEEVVFDGRKEEKMKKYLVTQEFMDELIEWRDDQRLGMNTELIRSFLDVVHIKQFPGVVDDWWTDPENTVENNKRLIAIIRWLNGEDVFEVEEQHKFVVRSEHTDRDGDYIYVGVDYEIFITYRCDLNCATKFDTREEAQEWANSHQVVVEIDEEGNEVEE